MLHGLHMSLKLNLMFILLIGGGPMGDDDRLEPAWRASEAAGGYRSVRGPGGGHGNKNGKNPLIMWWGR